MVIKAMRRFRTDFLAGIAVILPIIATVLIVRYLVITTNNVVLEPLSKVLEPSLKGSSIVLAKALIFIVVILVIVIVGMGTRLLILRRLFSYGERLLYRLPFVSRIYKAIKQISIAFLGEGKAIFKKVVLVQYPRAGLYSIGFMTIETKESIDKKTGRPTITVFIPTTPNPTSGMLVMVPKEDVAFLDMTVEDGMKLVVSGGAVTP